MGRTALGDCYRWAYNYVRKHPSAVLYQGMVTAPYADGPEEPFGHAWVVDGGVVKDWQTMVAGFGGRYKGKGWPVDVWATRWKPTNVRRYTLDQARAELLRNKHFGPWE